MRQYGPLEPKSTGKWGGDDGVRFDSRTAFWCGNQRLVRWETIVAFRFRQAFFFWLLFFLGHKKKSNNTFNINR
jgi:hypothetical protein